MAAHVVATTARVRRLPSPFTASYPVQLSLTLLRCREATPSDAKRSEGPSRAFLRRAPELRVTALRVTK